MADYVCTACNKSYKVTSRRKHEQSKIHAENAQKLAGAGILDNPAPPLNQNTARVYDNSKKYFDSITGYITPDEAYELVKSKNPGLRDSSIHTIIRMGYFRDNATNWSTTQQNEYIVYLRDLKDKFIAEQFDDDDKEAEQLPDIKTSQDNQTLPLELRLYMHLPLRIDSYTKLRITNKPLTDTNHVNVTDGTITLYNGKTYNYDTFKISNEALQFIRANFDKLKDRQLVKAQSSFHDMTRKHLKTNSQSIRRAFAEQVRPKTYAARVLQHSNATHRGHYIRK